MNVLLSGTRDHFVHMLEALFSIRRFSRNDINVYVIVDDTDLDRYYAIFDNMKMPGVNVVRIFGNDAVNGRLSDKIDCTYTKMAYGRVIFLDLVRDIDRILYVDTDVLAVNDGVDFLYGMDLAGKYAAVCDEVSVEAFAPDDMAKYGVSRFFNSGVMLLNLAQIRKDGVDAECSNLMLNPSYDIMHSGTSDQPLLNMAFKGNVVFVSPVFNIQSAMFGYPQYDIYAKMYGFSDQYDMMRHCVLSHTTGAKAWEDRWNTWQAWQLPYKKWQREAYLKNRAELIETYQIVKTLGD